MICLTLFSITEEAGNVKINILENLGYVRIQEKVALEDTWQPPPHGLLNGDCLCSDVTNPDPDGFGMGANGDGFMN